MKTSPTRETTEPVPPIRECVACGAEGSYDRALTQTQKVFRRRSYTVQHHHWKCRECGVAVLGDAEMEESLRAVVAAYQHARGLLTAEQIRAARGRRNWSPRRLAARAGLCIAITGRLEAGGIVQTRADDNRLREALGKALDEDFLLTNTEDFATDEERLSGFREDDWNDPGYIWEIPESRSHDILGDLSRQ